MLLLAFVVAVASGLAVLLCALVVGTDRLATAGDEAYELGVEAAGTLGTGSENLPAETCRSKSCNWGLS